MHVSFALHMGPHATYNEDIFSIAACGTTGQGGRDHG